MNNYGLWQLRFMQDNYHIISDAARFVQENRHQISNAARVMKENRHQISDAARVVQENRRFIEAVRSQFIIFTGSSSRSDQIIVPRQRVIVPNQSTDTEQKAPTKIVGSDEEIVLKMLEMPESYPGSHEMLRKLLNQPQKRPPTNKTEEWELALVIGYINTPHGYKGSYARKEDYDPSWFRLKKKKWQERGMIELY